MLYTEEHIAGMYRTGYEEAISDIVEFIRSYDEPIEIGDLLDQCEDLIAWAEEYEIPDDMLPKVRTPEDYALEEPDMEYARSVEGSLRP